jgi:hypothetical protein
VPVSDAAPVAETALLPAWLDDVTVEFGRLGAGVAGATAKGVLWAAAPGRLWLEVPGVARYLASEGRSLIVDPVAGADPAAVARFAGMAPLAALCYQRGMTVWHAATAVRDGGAVVLAGESGTGKSTLLAALMKRGWGMLGDELAALTVGEGDAVVALATGDEVRLWPDAIGRLEGQPGRGAAPAPDTGINGAGPRPLPAGDRARHGPTPIRSIWWLTLHNGAGVEITTEAGFARFDALGKLTFNGRVAHALLDRRAYLRIAAGVTSMVTHRQVRRPRGEWTVPELVDAIERDFARPAEGAG